MAKKSYGKKLKDRWVKKEHEKKMSTMALMYETTNFFKQMEKVSPLIRKVFR